MNRIEELISDAVTELMEEFDLEEASLADKLKQRQQEPQTIKEPGDQPSNKLGSLKPGSSEKDQEVPEEEKEMEKHSKTIEYLLKTIKEDGPQAVADGMHASKKDADTISTALAALGGVEKVMKGLEPEDQKLFKQFVDAAKGKKPEDPEFDKTKQAVVQKHGKHEFFQKVAGSEEVFLKLLTLMSQKGFTILEQEEKFNLAKFLKGNEINFKEISAILRAEKGKRFTSEEIKSMIQYLQKPDIAKLFVSLIKGDDEMKVSDLDEDPFKLLQATRPEAAKAFETFMTILSKTKESDKMQEVMDATDVANSKKFIKKLKDDGIDFPALGVSDNRAYSAHIKFLEQASDRQQAAQYLHRAFTELKASEAFEKTFKSMLGTAPSGEEPEEESDLSAATEKYGEQLGKFVTDEPSKNAVLKFLSILMQAGVLKEGALVDLVKDKVIDRSALKDAMNKLSQEERNLVIKVMRTNYEEFKSMLGATAEEEYDKKMLENAALLRKSEGQLYFKRSDGTFSKLASALYVPKNYMSLIAKKEGEYYEHFKGYLDQSGVDEKQVEKWAERIKLNKALEASEKYLVVIGIETKKFKAPEQGKDQPEQPNEKPKEEPAKVIPEALSVQADKLFPDKAIGESWVSWLTSQVFVDEDGTMVPVGEDVIAKDDDATPEKPVGDVDKEALVKAIDTFTGSPAGKRPNFFYPSTGKLKEQGTILQELNKHLRILLSLDPKALDAEVDAINDETQASGGAEEPKEEPAKVMPEAKVSPRNVGPENFITLRNYLDECITVLGEYQEVAEGGKGGSKKLYRLYQAQLGPKASNPKQVLYGVVLKNIVNLANSLASRLEADIKSAEKRGEKAGEKEKEPLQEIQALLDTPYPEVVKRIKAAFEAVVSDGPLLKAAFEAHQSEDPKIKEIRSYADSCYKAIDDVKDFFPISKPFDTDLHGSDGFKTAIDGVTEMLQYVNKTLTPISKYDSFDDISLETKKPILSALDNMVAGIKRLFAGDFDERPPYNDETSQEEFEGEIEDTGPDDAPADDEVNKELNDYLTQEDSFYQSVLRKIAGFERKGSKLAQMQLPEQNIKNPVEYLDNLKTKIGENEEILKDKELTKDPFKFRQAMRIYKAYLERYRDVYDQFKQGNLELSFAQTPEEKAGITEKQLQQLKDAVDDYKNLFNLLYYYMLDLEKKKPKPATISSIMQALQKGTAGRIKTVGSGQKKAEIATRSAEKIQTNLQDKKLKQIDNLKSLFVTGVSRVKGMFSKFTEPTKVEPKSEPSPPTSPTDIDVPKDPELEEADQDVVDQTMAAAEKAKDRLGRDKFEGGDPAVILREFHEMLENFMAEYKVAEYTVRNAAQFSKQFKDNLSLLAKKARMITVKAKDIHNFIKKNESQIIKGLEGAYNIEIPSAQPDPEEEEEKQPPEEQAKDVSRQMDAILDSIGLDPSPEELSLVKKLLNLSPKSSGLMPEAKKKYIDEEDWFVDQPEYEKQDDSDLDFDSYERPPKEPKAKDEKPKKSKDKRGLLAGFFQDLGLGEDTPRKLKLTDSELEILKGLIRDNEKFVKLMKKFFDYKEEVPTLAYDAFDDKPTKYPSKQSARMRSRQRKSPGTKGMGLPESIEEKLKPIIRNMMREIYG